MKKFLMMVVATLMCCTFVFAASQSQAPYEKGKYFGKAIIEKAFEEDDKGVEQVSQQLESYITNYIDTIDNLTAFIDGIKKGFEVGCKEAGLDDLTTKMIVKTFEENFTKALEKELNSI